MVVAHLVGAVHALVVHAAFEADGRGLRLGGLVVMALEDVDDRSAIGDHVALESPLASQLVLQKEFIGAGGLAVDAVIGAHHRAGFGLDDRGAEGRQIGVHLIVLAYGNVGGVARRFRAAVYGKVLGRGDGAVIARVVTLQSGNKSHPQARGKKGVFAIGFLAASPARIAKDVDVGRPEVEALEDVAVAGAHRLRVLDAPLDADDLGHLVNSRRVEGGSQADGLGEFGGAVTHHAVQRLAPPVVGGHIQPRNGARLIHQLGGLLGERHAVHQIGCALLGGQAGVKVGGPGVLRTGQRCHRAQRQHNRYPAQFESLHGNPLSVNSDQ